MKPVLYLIRGLPGSGKSTFARKFEDFRHLEADMYFINGKGEYVFDASKIKDAHDWCKSTAKAFLSEGQNVIISNTFTRAWELSGYIETLEEYTSRIKVYKVIGNFKNIHNVPEEAIKSMKERWEDYPGEVLFEND